MSIIYRIEHPDSGKGPYCHEDYLYDDDTMNDYSDELTEFQGELFLSHCDDEHPALKRPGCISGCDSLETLHRWFDGFIGDMRYLGFVLKVYSMKRVEKKDHTGQVIFRRKNATLIETRPL